MQHGVFYINESTERAAGAERCSPATPTRSASTWRTASKAGEGLVGQCALEKQSIVLTQVPGRLRPDQLGARRGDAAEHRRAAGAVRGRGEGGHRAGLVLPVQRHPPHVPRPAHREHRHRAQHDRGDDADRGAAEAVAVARRRAADAPARADRDEHAARAAGAHAAGVEERLKQQQEELQQTNEELEEKAELLAKQNREVENKNQRRSSWRGPRSRRRPSSSRSRRSTSRSSSRTCRTSCARRSTAC